MPRTDNMLRMATASAVAFTVLAAMAPGQAEAQANRTVTIVQTDEPTNLDACNSDIEANGRIIGQNVVESLTAIDPVDGTIKPRLATSWEKVDDTTWRFKLREGVKFSDGAPFNAETAAIGLERTMSKDAVVGAAGTAPLDCHARMKFFGDLQVRSKAVGEYVLEVTASKPEPILATRLAMIHLPSPNTPKDKLVLQPIGTGPYVVDHWTSGQEIVLRRNGAYWGEKPQAEVARYLWRKDSSVRAAMVKIGEADLASEISDQDAVDPKLDVSYLIPNTTSMRLDVNRAPLDDIRVRKALNLAVDRQGLRGSVLSKDVVPATQLVGPSILGHNHEIDKKVWPYDPAKARQLLAEARAAGAPVDKEIQLIGRINYYPNGNELMEALMGMYGAVGLNVKLTMLEAAEATAVARKPFSETRGPVVFQTTHDNNSGDPVFTVFNKYACDGTSSVLCNPELDKLIVKATAVSGDERTQTWREVFRIIYEDMVSDVMLFHMVGYARIGPRIAYKPTTSTYSEIQLAHITFR